MSFAVLPITTKNTKNTLTFMSRNPLVPKTIAGLLLFTAVSATANDLQGWGIPQVSLLKEFRPIGAAGNNKNSQLNPLPYTPEIALTPLNFASRFPGDALVPGPNPRYISNQISGGTGANGEELGKPPIRSLRPGYTSSDSFWIMISIWKRPRSPTPRSISSCRRMIPTPNFQQGPRYCHEPGHQKYRTPTPLLIPPPATSIFPNSMALTLPPPPPCVTPTER